MIIQTKLNNVIKEICLPNEVLLIYPKHSEWIEKCINEHRTCFIIEEFQMILGCAIVKMSRRNLNLLKLCFLYIARL